MLQSDVYFRPEAVSCEATALPADYYNLCRLYLQHSDGYATVPIGSMQYQAVITDAEIFFVDWSGRYAVDDEGNGGRIIRIAWRTTHTGERDSLHTPVPIEIIYYGSNLGDLQRRLHGDFFRALEQQEKKYQEHPQKHLGGATIIPWPSPNQPAKR